MRAMRFLAPAALAVAMMTGSAEAQPTAGAPALGVSMLGVGVGQSCGAWTAARYNRSTQQSAANEQWILGFLSGTGYAGGAHGGNPLHGVDADGVWAWIDNYCRNRPLDLLELAGAAFDEAHPR